MDAFRGCVGRRSADCTTTLLSASNVPLRRFHGSVRCTIMMASDIARLAASSLRAAAISTGAWQQRALSFARPATLVYMRAPL